MAVKKIRWLSAFLLLGLSSCAVSISLNGLDEATIDESLNTLSSRNTNVGSSYSTYAASVSEKYGDNYLSSDNTFSINPQGLAIPDEYYNQDTDRPNYAKVAIKNNDLKYKLTSFNSQSFGRYRLEF